MAKNKRQKNRKNRKAAKALAISGASAKQIKKKTGVSGSAARNIVQRQRAREAAAAAVTPSTATATTTPTAETISPKATLGQGLRIAGVGGLSRGELKTLSKTTGKSGSEIIQKLDKFNEKLKSKGKTGISLNAGAANRLIKRASKKQSSRRFGFNQFDFGEGRIGKKLTEMLGTPGSKGTYIKGQLVGARDAVDPTFLPGGMQIRPGGRERVIGWGKNQFKGTNLEAPLEEEPIVEDTEPVIPEPEPMLPPEEPVDNSASSGLGGVDLASWATGFKRAQSSRQKAGRQAKGLASQKKTPFKTWNQ